MKKPLKIVLISTLSVVGLIGCFALGVFLNGTCFDKFDEKGAVYKDWMKDISDERKLEDIVIPGSHDSGTYGMNWLGCTQSYSIKEQLYSGSRYLDLRINKKSEDEFVMYHGILNGTTLTANMKDIKDFIKDYPTETLLLDFQHFKGDAQEDVKDYLDLNFNKENLLVTNTTELNDLEYVSSLKMKDVRGKCRVFFGDNSSLSSTDFIFARNNDGCTNKGQSLNSCYISSYNRSSSEDYIKTGLPYYFENIKNKIAEEKFKGIFVLQGQLTDGKVIFGPFSREKSHNSNMSEYIKNLPSSEDFSLVNVIMRDFVTPTKNKQIIDLNTDKGNFNK